MASVGAVATSVNACGQCGRSRRLRCLCILFSILGAVAGLGRYVVFPLLAWRLAERCERPHFELFGVLDARDQIGNHLRVELRHYSPYLVAEVRLPTGLTEQQQRTLGFRQVAGYIFGGNKRRAPGVLGRFAFRSIAMGQEAEKIAMTVPVQQETASKPGDAALDRVAQTSVVSFTMPSRYQSLRDLPLPTNSNVTLRAVPEQYAAVIGFRGPPPKPEKVLALQSAIERSLQAAGIHPMRGRAALVYQYHDPFATPNILRWNEVVLLIEDPTTSDSAIKS
eukprot:TRINITY_DN33715_c0_g1_i1.p1 TRINITY_DN33715_c0_g1~~TRINITY_DN33715_c0_g1_i1.p1  ORF type:complete len:280 (-),score=36.47 TRINITY_DN33715_c0_g1_i1:424-1263(-)